MADIRTDLDPIDPDPQPHPTPVPPRLELLEAINGLRDIIGANCVQVMESVNQSSDNPIRRDEMQWLCEKLTELSRSGHSIQPNILHGEGTDGFNYFLYPNPSNPDEEPWSNHRNLDVTVGNDSIRLISTESASDGNPYFYKMTEEFGTALDVRDTDGDGYVDSDDPHNWFRFKFTLAEHIGSGDEAGIMLSSANWWKIKQDNWNYGNEMPNDGTSIDTSAPLLFLMNDFENHGCQVGQECTVWLLPKVNQAHHSIYLLTGNGVGDNTLFTNLSIKRLSDLDIING